MSATPDAKEARAPTRVAAGVLERLISATQDAVVFIDARAHIVEFNGSAERMFGFRAAEVIGKKVNLLMAEPYRTEHDGYVERYERTGEARAIGRIREVRGRRKSGEVFALELTVTELVGDDLVRYAAFLRDVSERAALQNKLLAGEALAALGTASAMLAHEIGNPLNNIALRAQLLMRHLKKDHPEARLDDLESILREVNRLSVLLQEFRLVSRRDIGDLAPCDLGEIASEVTVSTRHEAEAADVTVSCVIDPGPRPVLLGRADKLVQVLLNLCKNAIEAMPGGGSLTLHVGRDESGDRLTLDVTDTGVGLPDGDVFEIFRTTKPHGTGLGLAVVRQIVASHRGSVSATSEPGKGTTFHLVFPATVQGA